MAAFWWGVGLLVFHQYWTLIFLLATLTYFQDCQFDHFKTLKLNCVIYVECRSKFDCRPTPPGHSFGPWNFDTAWSMTIVFSLNVSKEGRVTQILFATWAAKHFIFCLFLGIVTLHLNILKMLHSRTIVQDRSLPTVESPHLAIIHLLRAKGCCSDQPTKAPEPVPDSPISKLVTMRQALEKRLSDVNMKLRHIPCAIKLEKEVN